jgi:GNAT superfamily N-acetyltransferase
MPRFTPATLDDLPALCALLGLLFTQEAEFKPDEAAQRQGLSTIIEHPEVGAILVAREGPDIVAMVNLLFTVSTALGQRVALLEDMVVAPGARGQGTGSALLTHAIAWAQGHGVHRITLLTDGDNHAAQRFYAQHGFQASGMVPMRLMCG